MIMTLVLLNNAKEILIPTIGFGIIAGKSEPEAASMKYTGKYQKMADQFRADGADEHLVNKFVREEMERDRYERNKGLTEIEAFQEWQSWTERDRQFFLNNALCPNCHLTSFAPDYTVRADSLGLIIEGTCARCGHRIARCCD